MRNLLCYLILAGDEATFGGGALKGTLNAFGVAQTGENAESIGDDSGDGRSDEDEDAQDQADGDDRCSGE